MARAVENNSSENEVKAADKAGKPASTSSKASHLQLVDGPIDPDARIGEQMRAARLSLGLEVDDVARQLRLRRDYITAIEAMQVNRLPKGFVNPYIRDYARAIKMNPNECVELFNTQCGALAQAVPEQVVVRKNDGGSHINFLKLGAAALGLVVAAGLGFAGYKFITSPAETDMVVQAPNIAITSPYNDGSRLPVTASPALSAATNAFNLEIRADRRAWIEIRGADGTLFIDRQLSRGDDYPLRVGAGWTLTTQDAGAFTWLVDGAPIAQVGEEGHPLYTLDIDGAANELRAQIEAAEQELALAE